MSIALVSPIHGCTITDKVLNRPEHPSKCPGFALEALGEGLRVLVDIVLLLAHGLEVPAPLGVVADGDGGGEGVVEPALLHVLGSPLAGVEEVLGVVRAGQPDVVGE